MTVGDTLPPKVVGPRIYLLLCQTFPENQARVMLNSTVTWVNEVTESTLNPSTSPAVTVVVQPVSVELSAFVVVVTVGLAAAVIVSATVGG